MDIGAATAPHITIESKMYASAGIPIMETDEIKLANSEKATGITPISPPASKTSLVLCLYLDLKALYIPILNDISNVTTNIT